MQHSRKKIHPYIQQSHLFYCKSHESSSTFNASNTSFLLRFDLQLESPLHHSLSLLREHALEIKNCEYKVKVHQNLQLVFNIPWVSKFQFHRIIFSLSPGDSFFISSVSSFISFPLSLIQSSHRNKILSIVQTTCKHTPSKT